MNQKKNKLEKSIINVGRRFFLKRKVDASGISGTGMVAFGVRMPSGKVVLEWTTKSAPSSEGIYESIEDCVQIHGHNGQTVVEWIDGFDLTFTQEALKKSK